MRTLGTFLSATALGIAVAATAEAELDRRVLPIVGPAYEPITEIPLLFVDLAGQVESVTVSMRE